MAIKQFSGGSKTFGNGGNLNLDPEPDVKMTDLALGAIMDKMDSELGGKYMPKDESPTEPAGVDVGGMDTSVEGDAASNEQADAVLGDLADEEEKKMKLGGSVGKGSY